MKRREFITLIGGAAAAWPLAARAQQSGKLRTIGFMGQSTRSAASEWVAAFVQRLRELGWIEGRNIAIEYRWAEGREERFAGIAAEFVRLKVDVIVTSGTPQVLAAKQATSVIPIVFASSGDPVAGGLVASLARPGGNATGLSTLVPDLAGKRIELLREVVPGLGRLAILGNVGNPISVLELDAVEAAAGTLGLKVQRLEIRRAQDITSAVDALKGRADALYVCIDALVNARGYNRPAGELDRAYALDRSYGSRGFWDWSRWTVACWPGHSVQSSPLWAGGACLLRRALSKATSARCSSQMTGNAAAQSAPIAQKPAGPKCA
jgi:putative ABC transport system substrate-binding protein